MIPRPSFLSLLQLSAVVLLASFLWYTHWVQALESYPKRSYDVFTLPVMYLDDGIDESHTDEIILAAPKLNGETITATPMSGAVFEFRLGSDKEDIYASRVMVNSSTKKLTLTGTIIRDLCQYTEQKAFNGCNTNNLDWPRGTEVRLSNNHRLFNLKLDVDRVNYVTDSGAIICIADSQPCIFPGEFTTAEINAFTFTATGGFHVLFDSTLGVARYYNPTDSAYINFGSGSTINATQSGAGKLMLGTLNDHSKSTATGSNGVNLTVWVANLVSSASVYYPASVTYGSGATSVHGSWAGIADGEFNVKLDGGSTDVVGITFSGVSSMDEVAERIEGELNRDATTGTGYLVTWQGDGTNTGFTLTSSNDTGTSSGSALSAVSGGAGTDISGAGGTAYMDGDEDSPNAQTFRPPVKNHPADQWKVPVLNHNGALDVSLGGTGTGDITAGAAIIGNGTGAVTEVKPTASGQVLIADSNLNFTASSIARDITEFCASTGSTTVGTSSTAEQDIDKNFTFPANSVSTGDTLVINGTLNVENAVGQFRVNLGGNTVAHLQLDSTSSNIFTSETVVRNMSASGLVMGNLTAIRHNANSLIHRGSGTTAINFTNSNVLKMTWQSDSSNAGYRVRADQLCITHRKANTSS